MKILITELCTTQIIVGHVRHLDFLLFTSTPVD